MNTQEKINLIESLIENYQEMSAQSDSMNKLFGIACDCEAMNPFWKCFDGRVSATAEIVGDKDGDWLGWFIWENKCGEKAMKAGYGKRLKPITTVKQLVKLIESK